MPVTGATTRNDYIASAGQTVFAYTFQILLDSDIKVIKNGTALTLNNDYTVSGAGVSGGGNVTLISGASLSDAVSIILAMPIDRTTEYQNAGDFLASDVNGDFDKGYIALNQLQTDVSRAVRLKDQDQSVNLELPLASTRANKFLRFKSDGSIDVTTGSPGAASTTDDITYDSGAVGSSETSLTDRLKIYISVKDFGAKGDGVTDDTSAVQACIDYVESLEISPQGTPVAYFPSGKYVLGGPTATYGITVRKANVRGESTVGTTLVWGGVPGGTCIRWESVYRKGFSGFRFRSLNKTVNDPKYWIDATWLSNPNLTAKLDYGDFFLDLMFEQTANVADACHMNLPKIINCFAQRLRFQAAPHLIRIAQETSASSNRVFAIQDWTTDFNQLPDGGVKSLFKVDIQGSGSLTLALSNARIETRNNAMGNPKAIVELHNTRKGLFPDGSQSFPTTTPTQTTVVLTDAPDDVEYRSELSITKGGVLLGQSKYTYDSSTKTVTFEEALNSQAVVVNWSPLSIPVEGISLSMRDMGIQLTKNTSPTNDSQISQEAVLIHHPDAVDDPTNVTSDIQLQNVFIDGFSTFYGGNWNTDFSTPLPSIMSGSNRIKFWSTGRVNEKSSQQLGDYVKIGDATQFHREAANYLSMAGVGTDVAMTLDVHGDINVSNNEGVTKAGFTGSNGSLRVGNAVAATTLSSVTKKIEVFNQNGVSLGFVPVYATIT